jgi:uncharacterized protein (TIGR03435 family)
MRARISTVAALCAASSVFAQDTPVKASFEVASVRQCRDDERSGGINYSPDRLSMNCWPLRRILEEAYDTYASGSFDPRYPPLADTPMEGLPEWAASSRYSRYSITAKTALPQTRYMMRGPMMQALLEDRFHLKVHSETREVPSYLLTIAKDGPKLSPAQPGRCTVLDPTDTSLKITPEMPFCIVMPPVRKGSQYVWDVRGITMGAVAKRLRLDLPVIDRTGLTGAFDIFLEYTHEQTTVPLPGGAEITESDQSGFIQAFRKQLGLEFVRGRGPRKFLVIDHMERLSEN